MNSKHIINSLPLLASALGRKYGVRVEIGGCEAKTDGNVIYLPALPLDSDEDLLTLIRGFLDHESAHIRSTNFKALTAASLTPLEHYLCNVLEDYRVERKLTESFPGSRHNFKNIIRHIFLENREAAPGLNAAQSQEAQGMEVLNWILLQVRAWEVPELKHLLLDSEREMDRLFPGLRQVLHSTLRTVPLRCVDTRRSIDVGLELVNIIRRYMTMNEQSLTQPAQESAGQIAPGENDMNNQSPGNTGAVEEPGGHIQGASQASSGQAQNDGSASKAPSAPGQDDKTPDVNPLKRLLVATSQELPKDVGRILSESVSSKHDTQGDGIRVAVVKPRSSFELSDSDLNASRLASTALRARLSGLLQSKRIMRNRSGFTGRLDSTRLHKLCLGEPRVFLRRGERQGLNSAAHILLDASGSMSGYAITLACQACFAVASALHSLPGVSVGVTAFPGAELKRHEYSGSAMRSYESVSPLLRHDGKIHRRFSIGASGNTPMTAALWWVLQSMSVLPERRKIILVITDGMPDSVPGVQAAIKSAETYGYEVYGIGIKTPSLQTLMAEGQYRNIEDIYDLAPAMFAVLGGALLRGTQA